MIRIYTHIFCPQKKDVAVPPQPKSCVLTNGIKAAGRNGLARAVRLEILTGCLGEGVLVTTGVCVISDYGG